MDANDNSAGARPIPVSYDKDGNPFWSSVLSPPDDTFALCMMVPDRIIPIIFVPGVMGTNLKCADGVKWRLDSNETMAPWMKLGAEKRKKYLTPTDTSVDKEGVLPAGTAQSEQELRNRGWGEIGYPSYGEFLVWLENALNDFDNPHGGVRDSLIGVSLNAVKGEEALIKDEVACSYRYRFPVHVCGYNWLASNVVSSQTLKKRIEDVIARYQRQKKKCEKVIIVTHSMGGLVARHCSEVLGMHDRIFGIVHGVMPAIGAAVVYRRMKAGTEYPHSNIEERFFGYLTSLALGSDAAEMTAVLSSAPGPLQLLPTPEYGNGWLKIDGGQTVHALPQNGDPYNEIYTVRDAWWGLCADDLINPLNKESDPHRRSAIIDSDWNVFEDIIRGPVKQFHYQLIQKYHSVTFSFYGSSPNHKAYGDVSWRGAPSFGERWLSGNRTYDDLHGKTLDRSEINTTRTVAAPLEGTGWKKGVHMSYSISGPDEDGDGTVPRRSGLATRAKSQSMLRIATGHESAFRESSAARQFTIRAIVKISQAVKQTTLAYDR